MQSDDIRKQIAAMSRELGQPTLGQVQALYRAEQDELARHWTASAVDVPYGAHARQKLDIYSPRHPAGPVPIMLWVHGGGHVRGGKSSPTDPYEANVGRWAAMSGYLGVCMNYRLAPEFRWPAAGEDVGSAVAWLKQHAAGHGGDPHRIAVLSTSAGAVNAATYLQLNPDTTDVMGVALLSGTYGYTPFPESGGSRQYFSENPADWPQQVSGPALEKTQVPLFVSCAQYDLPRFQQEFNELLQRRLAAHGTIPHAHILNGHNHYSQPFHIGTTDTRLTDELLAFVRDVEAAHPARVQAAARR